MTYEEFAEQYNIHLNEKQKEAVIDEHSASLLLAVPGSGKTTVIVAKTGYMILCRGISAADILTVTYSKAAAIEMEQRFKQKFPGIMAPHFSTIHSFCYSVLRYCRDTYGTSLPTLVADNESIIRKLLWDMSREYPSLYAVRDAALGITSAKNKMLDEEDIHKIKLDGLMELGIDFPQFYEAYQKHLSDNDLMDFDDMLVFAYDMLVDSIDLLSYYQERYRYVNVDEAQDTSLLQHRIIQLLGLSSNIFMVGDDDQSIYGFRGADPTNLLDFENIYPEAQTFFMETNYRCGTNIANAADKFIKGNKYRYEKSIHAQQEFAGEILMTRTPTRESLYDEVMGRIRSALTSGDGTLGILYRNNESGFPLAEAIIREGLKVKRRDSFDVFFEYPVIRDILDFLSFALNPHDEALFMRLYFKFNLYLRKDIAQAAVEYHNEHPDKTLLECVAVLPHIPSSKAKQIEQENTRLKGLTVKSPTVAIQNIWDYWYEVYVQRNKQESKFSALQKMGCLLVPARHYKNIREFLLNMRSMQDSQEDTRKSDSNVTVTTIHSAKGLEFDHVILIDAIDGIFPPERWSDKTHTVESEEETRLFYVAVTRAKKSLEFLVPSMSYGEYVSPSRFVVKLLRNIKKDELPAEEPPKKAKRGWAKPIEAGCSVRHVKFGEGKVTEVAGDIVTIKFDSQKTPKKLLISACKKQKLLEVL